jgi:hypothetical protein
MRVKVQWGSPLLMQLRAGEKIIEELEQETIKTMEKDGYKFVSRIHDELIFEKVSS